MECQICGFEIPVPQGAVQVKCDSCESVYGLQPMTVEKTVTIEATGVLTVTVTPEPPKGYLGRTFNISVDWSPVSGQPCKIDIDYGDGVTESRSVVFMPPEVFTHKYAAVGPYTITATVFDEYTGASGTSSASVEVASELVASLTADKTTGPVPLTVTFTMSWSGGYSPYTATLDPGDGTAPYTVTPGTKAHTYIKKGTFFAKLTVTDSQLATASKEVAVGAGVVVAEFPTKVAVGGSLTAILVTAVLSGLKKR